MSGLTPFQYLVDACCAALPLDEVVVKSYSDFIAVDEVVPVDVVPVVAKHNVVKANSDSVNEVVPDGAVETKGVLSEETLRKIEVVLMLLTHGVNCSGCQTKNCAKMKVFIFLPLQKTHFHHSPFLLRNFCLIKRIAQ